MQKALAAVEFSNPVRAGGELDVIFAGLPADLRERIESLLASSPDPTETLHSLAALRAADPQYFLRYVQNPASLQQLIAVFSHSRFLAEELRQHPQWLQSLGGLESSFTAQRHARALDHFLQSLPPATAPALALASFRRKQLLRILLRDVFGIATLSETTEDLSDLSDAILETSLRRIESELEERHGIPQFTDEHGHVRRCGFTVLALGKLGGRELNYSSDIDLMFLYTANGETSGPQTISNREFCKKVANQYTALLSTYSAEGICYRVDLRLRPEGSLGEVCLSLDGAKQYYASRARDWELQMLIKARVAAGDRDTGRQLLEFVEPQIYSSTLDFSAIEVVSVTRERIGEKLARRKGSRSAFDVKLAPGGIRDIEFLVQCLQRLHGGRVPWVRQGGTLLALARLADKNFLSESEYGKLASAYQFLRHLEHRLQLVDDRQTHTLPTEARDLALLARRMPEAQRSTSFTTEDLLRELNTHLESVQEIYERVIHAQRPMYYTTAPATRVEVEEFTAPTSAESSNLVRFLDQRAPQLATALARGDLRRGARAFEHFLEKVVPRSEWLAILNGDPVLARYTLDIFEHSPHLSDELIRTPELLEQIAILPGDPRGLTATDPADLRRHFRREMFRIQAASLCLATPIFLTLEQTSELADAAIRAAYVMALKQIAPDASPESKLMVIALGRLGMREFDLASDADLLFVLPDSEAPEQVFWTRVAERMIHILSAYTGEGLLFTVDARLRPNGNAGALVQSESGFYDYFSKHAEAWEGIAYMKARAVAGNLDQATTFLNQLQEVDWRRYGQSGRSRKDLRQMRLRLEKEQGAANPLKAGVGGYYDTDFALMYLRLKGAGIFFKVLNTPERIDVVEKMGHLERADAEFLRDAVTFYRAVDHALRLYSGHAEGTLPPAQPQLTAVAGLVRRWVPDHLNGRPLPEQLAHIQERTRGLFNTLFT